MRPSDVVGRDLADRLVAASLDLLAREPAERLSLRRVAEAVGVSHQAPYVHFHHKRGFLAAVAGAGLQRAVERAEAEVAGSGPEPGRRLQALVAAYVDFVREQPHVHDLAYGALVSKSDHPALQAAAARHWTLLHDTVAACQPPGTSAAAVLRRCAAVWGTVYGIARLGALHQVPPGVPGSTVELIDEAVDALRRGWLADDGQG